MPRYTRNTVIMAKIEGTPGTDAVPVANSNAILVRNSTFDPIYNNVKRELIRPYMGGAEELQGTRFIKLSFEVEFANSGTLGTPPAWGPLVRACAFSEVIAAGVCVSYAPVSSGIESLTIYYYKDGLLKKGTYGRGTVKFGMLEGDIPGLKFEFTLIDAGIAVSANPDRTLTAWKPPLLISNGNSGDIRLGSTLNASTGVISGGTAYISRGLELDLGGSISQISMLNAQGVDFKDREVTGSCQFELTADQEATFLTDIYANTLTSLSFEHGTTAGGKIAIFGSTVQRTSPKDVDYEGRMNLGVDLRFTPASSANSELRIICK
jgi:hypothetical protein